MVIHECEKCKKIFNKKSNYLTHINNKKYPCNYNGQMHNNIHNILQDNTQIDNDIINKIIPIVNNVVEKRKNTLVNNNIKHAIKCLHCECTFSRKDSLTRHINNFCKEKKTDDELNKLKLICSELKAEIDILKSNNQDIHNTNKRNNINNTMNKNSHNTTNNTLNNTTTNSNNTNSNNNITIVQFGKEDLSKMNLEEMMKVYLKSTGGNIIANMLKYINLNPEYPENNNIFMTDLAREIVRIHDGKKFVSKKFKSIKDNIINNVSTHITDICDKYLLDDNYEKNESIKNKIYINDTSLKLISGIDAEDIVREEIKEKTKEKTKEIELKSTKYDKKGINNELYEDYDSESDIELDLSVFDKKRIVHLENKREGLEKITVDKIKDELYNNKS